MVSQCTVTLDVLDSVSEPVDNGALGITRAALTFTDEGVVIDEEKFVALSDPFNVEDLDQGGIYRIRPYKPGGKAWYIQVPSVSTALLSEIEPTIYVPAGSLLGDTLISAVLGDVDSASRVLLDEIFTESGAGTVTDAAVGALLTAGTATKAALATEAADDDTPLADALNVRIATKGDTRYLRTAVATIIGLGNSIESNGVLCYYDRIISGALSFSPNSYMGWAMPKVGGKFRLKGVAAVGGYHMENIIADLLQPAIAAAPDYMHLQVWTNNLAGIINGTQTLADAKALYMQIVDAITAAGIVPIIATVNPVDSFSTGTSLTVITKVNLWLKWLATTHGWPLVDYHAAVVNPTNNQYITGYSTDGTHLTSTGAKAMGDALALVLQTIPSNARAPLWDSYNPNLMQPDCCMTSALADKYVGTGTSSGGFAFKTVSGPIHKGNSVVITRGTAGDYTVQGSVTPGAMIAGHRVRLSFNLDASAVPAGGLWSAYLYNLTQFKVVAGFSSMDAPLTNKSITVLGGTTTSGSKVVTAAAGTFRPEHVGCVLSASVTVNNAVPPGTLVTGVSPDGTTAYISANATLTGTGTACVTVTGPPPVVTFEFIVQPDMVGNSFLMYCPVAGAAGTTLGVSQVTLADLTALEVAT